MSNPTPTAGTSGTDNLVFRDQDGNFSSNNITQGYTATATAAGTTTLTVASTTQQFFTGSTTQTLVLPVVSTLSLGTQYRVINRSTGVVTVQSSGLNTIQALEEGTVLFLTVIAITGTGIASWNWSYIPNIPAQSVAWTPVLAFGGGSTGITYSTQTGTYVRIEDMLVFRCTITLTSKGSDTGDMTVSGLPLSPSALTGVIFRTETGISSAGADSLEGVLSSGGDLYGQTLKLSTGVVTTITNVEFVDTASFTISGSYIL